MKAARVLQFGPQNVITNDDLPRPELGGGQLLVRVKAAGVGHWDALVREGKLPNEHLPVITENAVFGNHNYDRASRSARACTPSHGGSCC